MADADDQNKYSFDSSALIHAWRRSYPPKHFPQFWGRIDGLIDEGRLFCSSEVVAELKKKDDELFAWCKTHPALSVEISEELQDHLTEIMGMYPRLVDTTKGRSTADPFVIALARMQDPEWVVVTEENPGRVNSPKIPDVCKAEDIRCMRLVELIQEEDWIFR
ncbi:MAG: DUF4411 family protein [Betaproteobacteria bacterium]|nr:MAG: DUF4411 family protein [Betaproteobacteria bacterium]